jgi:hypothetical protein
MHDDLPAAVRSALEADAAVRSVRLVGSRAEGTASVLSDWDFAVETDDFGRLAPRLPRRVEPLDPLVAQWDPLGKIRCYMLIVRGPTKIDLIFDETQEESPPWSVTRETLPGVDGHFWDWALWLAAKAAGGKDEVVAQELQKMHRQLLGPLGVEPPPRSVDDAVDAYLAARDAAEARLSVRVPRTLEREVRPAVVRGA